MNTPSIYFGPCELGRGLFAARDFQPGEAIFCFVGRFITFEEACSMGEAEANTLQIGTNSYLHPGPPGVFANHSCDPNAGIRNTVEVHALRSIRRDEEIRFDYSTSMSERRWTMPCRCGTPVCRGVVRDFHELPDALQRHYLALKVVQPFIVEEWLRLQKGSQLG
jgi:hypothetical protein